MSEWVFVVWALLAAAGCAGVLGAALAGRMAERRRRSRDRMLRPRYLHTVLWALAGEGSAAPRFPQFGCAGTRRLLAETVAGVTVTTYGSDPEPLRRIAEACGVVAWTLRRIRRSRGYGRARYLALLARLPVGPEAAARVARYAGSRHAGVRFQTLLVRLVADPSLAFRLIADFPTPFSPCEVAELLAVLRRGMLPIAWRPLLAAREANLRRLGLEIVRQFEIVEAVPFLRRMAVGESEPDLGIRAVYALCALRQVEPGWVTGRLSLMAPAERRSLLRWLAAEGASAELLAALSGWRERPYCETLVSSYKCTLA